MDDVETHDLWLELLRRLGVDPNGLFWARVDYDFSFREFNIRSQKIVPRRLTEKPRPGVGPRTPSP